jgi:hypothetical protein
MPVDKRNISISFGQGIDTKTDPNQVMPGKLLALSNATLSETLAINKRNGNQSISTFFASSTLTNQKIATFNNQLIAFDGKKCTSLGQNQQTFIDNFIGAQPSISTIANEATPIINPDIAYNANYNTSCVTWSSSCVAQNFQQLAFSSATGKIQLTTQNGSILASSGIFGFAKTRIFSSGNNFYWTGITASNLLAYYQIPANGSSANFNAQSTIGSVGPDLSSNTNQTGYNTYQRYDGASLASNLYVGYFNPATSTVNVALVTVSGVTLTQNFQANASGSFALFGDNSNVWVTYHDGATSAGFAVLSTSSLNFVTNPSPFFTTDGATTGNVVSTPQVMTGIAQGGAATVYTQFYNKYPPTQYSGATITWNSLQRTDFIASQSLNLTATSGSSAVVVRAMGLASKAFRYLGDDFFLASYGGTQTSTSADRLEPTNFLVCATKPTNRIVSKISFQNGAGYDFQTGGQYNYGVNNYGTVGYGLPLPNVTSLPSQPNVFNIPYLLKTAAIPLSSTSISEPFFISYNFGYNVGSFNFNAPTLYTANSYGNNLNVAGGYLSAFDGKNINEQNFHLYPEDVQIVGSSSFGPAANTYSYQAWYQYQDLQGNIFRSAPSKTYNITTAGSSAMYLLIPTCRATNKQGVTIHVARNAPTIDPLTFHDIAPLTPALNNPNVDNVVVVDSNPDSAIIGNPDIYTTGGVLEDTGAPSPLWMTTYKLRLMVLDPENNIWWYSKEVIPGTSVEMTDLQTFSVSTKYGNSFAGLEMDDKFILFQRSMDGSLGAIYYMTGEGPTATGSDNDFSLPTLITSTLTTNNPNSLVLTPDGIMFQSDKGIWVLGHDLSTQYVGSSVESYNSQIVTSANVVPNTTQVRFTLNNGVALVWDYFQRQWSVFSNINATHGLIFQSLFTYLNQNGPMNNIFQETIGKYLDGSAPVLMSLTTGWLSIAGLQGFQRAYRMYLLGQSQSAHLLNASVAYDFNPSLSQTAVMRPLPNANGTWGSDPFWGANLNWGGYAKLEQFRMNFNRQKCQSIQISIQESLDPSNIQYGAGPVLEAVGLVIGGKLSYPKIPDSLSVK